MSLQNHEAVFQKKKEKKGFRVRSHLLMYRLNKKKIIISII